MKDVTNIHFNTPFSWIHGKRFHNEELCESKHVLDATWHTRCILDAYYENDNLSKITSENKHLTDEKRAVIHTLPTKYQFLFDGSLGTWGKIL